MPRVRQEEARRQAAAPPPVTPPLAAPPSVTPPLAARPLSRPHRPPDVSPTPTGRSRAKLAVSIVYEAGSAYRIQPHLRSNARAVDRSTYRFENTILYRIQTVRPVTVRALRSARRPDLAAISPNILKIAITRNGPPFTVRYALQKPPPRARHVVYARDGAGNSRSICAFASRILGSTDLGSTAIKCHFGFKNEKDHLSKTSYRAER